MTPAFHVHHDGRYRVCMTTNGIDHQPVPSGVFGSPRDAIRYAEMRELRISPLRDLEVPEVSLPSVTSGSLTRP